MHPANKWLIGVVSSTLIGSAGLWEGTRYYAYYDIVGVPTVCQGYTGKGIIFGKKYSPEECNAYTRTELRKHGEGVLACINVPIKEHEYNAYTLFAYNVGVAGFCGSRAVKILNAGDHIGACNALLYGPQHGKRDKDGNVITQLVWVYAGGKYVKGLENRRKYEVEMCKGTNEH